MFCPKLFIAEQLKMKIMFMQGLKNILKGSLSNQILGDTGGFSYQGQNIYVKAVKCKFKEHFKFIQLINWKITIELMLVCQFQSVLSQLAIS